MGLSGSGKTFFYNSIKGCLGNHLYLNGDIVRTKYNDWDFSPAGVIRQAKRINQLASESDIPVVVDIICPLRECRQIISPGIIFFIDRIQTSQYKDTERMFERPTQDECGILFTIGSNIA
jgi:hypothetical protein